MCSTIGARGWWKYATLKCTFGHLKHINKSLNTGHRKRTWAWKMETAHKRVFKLSITWQRSLAASALVLQELQRNEKLFNLGAASFDYSSSILTWSCASVSTGRQCRENWHPLPPPPIHTLTPSLIHTHTHRHTLRHLLTQRHSLSCHENVNIDLIWLPWLRQKKPRHQPVSHSLHLLSSTVKN